MGTITIKSRCGQPVAIDQYKDGKWKATTYLHPDHSEEARTQEFSNTSQYGLVDFEDPNKATYMVIRQATKKETTEGGDLPQVLPVTTEAG